MLVNHNGTLLISGELNFKTAAILWKQSLAELAKMKVCHFDFSGITASNSAGIALMLEWIKYAKAKKLQIHFSHIPPSLLSIARVSGIDKIINLL